MFVGPLLRRGSLWEWEGTRGGGGEGGVPRALSLFPLTSLRTTSLEGQDSKKEASAEERECCPHQR